MCLHLILILTHFDFLVPQITYVPVKHVYLL